MKDLFRTVLSKISVIEFVDYCEDYVFRAPFWLLDAAARAHGDVATCAAFEPLYTFLSRESRGHWNDPEIYPHLLPLLGARDAAFDVEPHLWALQGHLGLRDVHSGMFNHRYFRRHGSSPIVFERSGASIRPVTDAILIGEAGFPVVYRPLPHLFDDVVGGSVTYVGSASPLSDQEMKHAVRSAMNLIGRYDADLHQGVTSAIGVIAITGEWQPGDRSSYSMGKSYTGGIFTSVSTESAVLLAESLIHEYYHQRIWLWWLIEAPPDLPPRHITMKSTVSGQQRPVSVMMHALLIYASLIDFYRWAEGSCSDEGSWIGHRWRSLTAGAILLRDALRGQLQTRPDCLRFVDAIAESL